MENGSFKKFAELLLANSSGMFEAIKYATARQVARPTIANYLDVLEATFVVHVIRPHSTHRPTEIVLAPKVYGFDTGFVCYAQGKNSLRAEDTGLLWEHCVLNEMHGQLQTRAINYWRDKSDHEIDFVLRAKDEARVAIECKFISSADDLKMGKIGKNFEAFRALYPEGDNFVVSSNIDHSFTRQYHGLTIHFVNTQGLIKKLMA